MHYDLPSGKKTLNNYLMARIYQFCYFLLPLMKISIPQVMLMILCMGVTYANKAEGQNVLERKISLSLNNEELKTALTRIENASNVRFVYNHREIKVDRKISLNVRDEQLKEVLSSLLAPLKIRFEVNGNHIILLNQALGLLNSSPLIRPFERPVKGKVVDEKNEPVIGATVMLKGTARATMTDTEGNFALQVEDEKSVLVVSFIGYTTQEVTVGTQAEVLITLTSGLQALDEVVVVGYGTQKRGDLTGSVASIKGERLTAQAVRSPMQALSGQVPGVQVMQNSGQPGGGISVRVRGGNSVHGSNEPLYVVDGFPINGSPDLLNPNDILSMEILKDASATAIYGSRGANGVVMITTKKGTTGKTRVEYSAFAGIQNAARRIDMLNAAEFATLANLRAANDNEAPYFTASEINQLGTGTNWQDEIFQSAVMQNHSISVMGGSDKTRVNLSGNFLDQDGIILNSNFRQYQLRANVDHNINDRLKVGIDNVLSSNYTRLLTSDNAERGSGVLSGALIAPPTVLPVNPDGSYGNVRQYVFSPDIAENPVAMALEPRNETRRNSIMSNAYIDAELLPDLKLRSSIGLQYDVYRYDVYLPTTLNRFITGTASIRYNEQSSIVNENILTYSTILNADHSLTLMGGVTAQKNIEKGLLAQATGFSTNTLENNNLQSATNPGIPESGINEFTILSGLARANYSYKSKYLLTASIRADGSSRFGADNKWGRFPSVAAAWRVSHEDFWEPMLSVISDLKLRSSWGTTGSTAVSPYQSLNVLASYTTVFDNNLVIGFAPSNVKPNPALKWETTTQFDGGVDVGLFRNRLSLVFDFYYKRTKDLLTPVPQPYSSGYATQIQNIGSIQNKGIDISLNGTVLNKGDVNWNLGANFSINRNKVLSLVGGADIPGVTLKNPLSVPVNVVREGYPLGVFLGFVEDGLTPEGNIKYVDQDANGTINNLDRVIIGNPNPKFTFGLNSTVTYRNFDLSFLINGVQGNDIFNFNLANLADGFAFGLNQVSDVLGNYWTPENPNTYAKYPRISKATQYRASDRFVEDGSYIRMRNVQLGYTFAGNGVLNKSQVYLAAQNLFTITNYSFYSPEVNTQGVDMSRGIDMYGYPDAKTFMLGVRLKL